MRKQIFTILFVSMAIFAFGQDTIIGWTFPNGVEEDLNANLGTEQNMEFDIRKEDVAGGEDAITFTNGTGENDFAATAENWDNGAENKFWSIKFKAARYRNFMVSSKQRAGGDMPGPRDWKLQFRLSGQEIWTDIEEGAITVANNWTTGLVEDLPIPEEANYPESSVYIRWIMTSNLDINGDEVLTTGISKIDDIIVTGVSPTDVRESIVFKNSPLYPNPCTTTLFVDRVNGASTYTIYNLAGQKVAHNVLNNSTINVPNQLEGYYLFVIYNDDGDVLKSEKVLIK